jgi:hypothetical protein
MYTAQYTEALQYSKAPYATDSALVNVDEIGNVLFGKRVRNASRRRTFVHLNNAELRTTDRR